MNANRQHQAALIADLLDSDDELFELFANAITDARDKAPRLRDEESGDPVDRDSADVLTDVIEALREAC